MPPSARPQHRRVELGHSTALEGARNAMGVVVVIDVLRTFTVSAYALLGCCLPMLPPCRGCRGAHIDLVPLRPPQRESDRHGKVMAGEWPGLPATEIKLAMAVDRFDFAMPATRRDGHVLLNASFPPR